MAELVDMALPKPKKGDKAEGLNTGSDPGKEPKYPWGLGVRLDNEEIKKLGLKIKDFDTDTVVRIVAKAETTRVSEDDIRDGGKRQSLSFQITAMTVTLDGKDDFASGWDKASEDKKPEKGK